MRMHMHYDTRAYVNYYFNIIIIICTLRSLNTCSRYNKSKIIR